MNGATAPNSPVISHNYLGLGISAQEVPASSSSISPKSATPSTCLPSSTRSKSTSLSHLLPRSESSHSNYSVYHPFGSLASSLSDIPSYNTFADNAADPVILDTVTTADVMISPRNGRNQRRPLGRARASATDSDVQMQTLADVSAAATRANGSNTKKRRTNGNGPAAAKRRKREADDDDGGAYPQPSKRSTRGSRTATSNTPVASPSIGEAVLPSTEEASIDEASDREPRPRWGKGGAPVKRGVQRTNSSTNEVGDGKEEDVGLEVPNSTGEDEEAKMVVDTEAEPIQHEPPELPPPSDSDTLDASQAIITHPEANTTSEAVINPTSEVAIATETVLQPTTDEAVSQPQLGAHSVVSMKGMQSPNDLPLLKIISENAEQTNTLGDGIGQESSDERPNESLLL